ncbi:hypothetical protein L1049_018825 [Liquidambar formosana]|uniref:Uncharacterized protein n=1 Tax=Liquidambar formosana TaxID=63359 RepID=A0AAP0RAL5_LIQFO
MVRPKVPNETQNQYRLEPKSNHTTPLGSLVGVAYVVMVFGQVSVSILVKSNLSGDHSDDESLDDMEEDITPMDLTTAITDETEVVAHSLSSHQVCLQQVATCIIESDANQILMDALNKIPDLNGFVFESEGDPKAYDTMNTSCNQPLLVSGLNVITILFIIPDPEVTFSFPWAVPPDKIDPFGSWSFISEGKSKHLGLKTERNTSRINAVNSAAKPIHGI